MSSRLKNKIVRKSIKKQTALRTETRDAILWDIFPDERYCRVKIQGNNTLIRAYYPENWEQSPYWLKPKNAVRIMHTGGNRARIELIGPGQYIPNPTDASMFPTEVLGEDAVLSGCSVNPFDAPSMNVYITTGAYRIDDVIYILDDLEMSETCDVTMYSGVPMGQVNTILRVNAAHSTLFRLDIFVVGVDGVLDYIAGTAAVAPEMPSVPDNHVMLGWVFIPPGTTEINDYLINRTYVEPFVSMISLTVADDELTAFGAAPDITYETETTITVNVLDQYGNLMVNGTNWGIKAEFIQGGGLIDEAYPSKTKYIGTDATGIFTYTRSAPTTDKSPIIKFSLVQNEDIFGLVLIYLYNELGTLV